MTEVTAKTVEHVARLARLSLSEAETGSLANDLRQILDYADSLNALDLSGVEPMSHAGSADAARADELEPSLPREAALANAPDAEGGLFRVPRVIGA
jgi:aspartyl-tRNA(Asn)/glutamyl-tRNA(Gln) amidotransferase subunit C